MAVFSGLYESPGPPPSGDARGIVPPHRDGHRNGHQSGYINTSLFCLFNIPSQTDIVRIHSEISPDISKEIFI